jgi:hypothetical protein
MSELIEFLRARLDDDQEAVNWDEHPDPSTGTFLTFIGDGEISTSTRRVAAEIDAKRRIIDLHSGDNDEPCQTGNWVYEPCPTLRLLTLPYADHPDYQPEWRP